MERFKLKCRSSISSSPTKQTSSLFSIVPENKLYKHVHLLLIVSHVVASTLIFPQPLITYAIFFHFKLHNF